MPIDHDTSRANRRHLRLFTTGGTIASRRDPTTGAVAAAASGEQLLARLPELPALTEIDVEPVASVNGWNVTPELMFDLGRRVNKTLASSAVDGIIVTHGTDTVEETAFLLDLLVSSPKPVVFAVALRHLDELGTDGPRNLRDAIAVAASPASHGRGTLLVANQAIHTARFVTKVHTTSLDAFASPGRGPEGFLNGTAVKYLHPLRARQAIEVDRVETRVLLLKAYAGADDSLLHHGIAAGYRGFVIEGTGSGNVPAAMVPGIEAALHGAIPVVLCSRVPDGPLTSTYGGGPAARGGGHDLASLGVIPAPGLSGQKARIMLMVALGLTSDREIIRSIFRDGTGA